MRINWLKPIHIVPGCPAKVVHVFANGSRVIVWENRKGFHSAQVDEMGISESSLLVIENTPEEPVDTLILAQGFDSKWTVIDGMSFTRSYTEEWKRIHINHYKRIRVISG